MSHPRECGFAGPSRKLNPPVAAWSDALRAKSIRVLPMPTGLCSLRMCREGPEGYWSGRPSYMCRGRLETRYAPCFVRGFSKDPGNITSSNVETRALAAPFHSNCTS